MKFQSDKVPEFVKVFEDVRNRIESFPGCDKLDLWRDTDDSNVFFTYSIWTSIEELENYRSSQLFRVTWRIVREFFADRPIAWSLEQHIS